MNMRCFFGRADIAEETWRKYEGGGKRKSGFSIFSYFCA